MIEKPKAHDRNLRRGFLAQWMMSRALKRCVRRLPKFLAQDYGHRGPFTPAQIEKTVRRTKAIPERYMPYALAIFGERSQVERVWRELGTARTIDDMRLEVAGACLSTDGPFSQRDLDRYIAEYAWSPNEHHVGVHDVSGHVDGGGGHHS